MPQCTHRGWVRSDSGMVASVFAAFGFNLTFRPCRGWNVCHFAQLSASPHPLQAMHLQKATPEVQAEPRGGDLRCPWPHVCSGVNSSITWCLEILLLPRDKFGH